MDTIATNDKKRWPMALVIIGIVLIASVVMYFIHWETNSQFSLWGYLFGLPIGIIIGYGWNLLIFSPALRLLRRVSASWRALSKPNDERKWLFLSYLALLNVPIGETYAMMTWKDSY